MEERDEVGTEDDVVEAGVSTRRSPFHPTETSESMVALHATNSTITISFGKSGVCFQESANVSCSAICSVQGLGTHKINLENAGVNLFARNCQPAFGVRRSFSS